MEPRHCLAVKLHAIARDQAGLRMPSRDFNLHFKLFGQPQVVGVEQSDVVPVRRAQAGVARGGESSMLLLDESDVREVRFDPRERFVGGPVINQNDLALAVGLGERAFQRLRQVKTRVVGSDDDADSRAGHGAQHPAAEVIMARSPSCSVVAGLQSNALNVRRMSATHG